MSMNGLTGEMQCIYTGKFHRLDLTLMLVVADFANAK